MGEQDEATDGYYWDGQQWQPADDEDVATPVDVVYQIDAISQPAAHASWATAFAMVINHRDGSSLAPADVGDAVGADLSFVESWSDVIDAASHFELRECGSAGMDVRRWARLLAENGPLWMCVHSGGHAVVLHGIYGDGTEDGTKFYVTDPVNGYTDTDVTGLNAMFEAVDTEQPGDRLVIWHR
jgi:hypothetical protein